MRDASCLGSALVLVIAAGSCLAAPAQSPDRIEFASHRAVYDLKLSSARGNRPVEAVRGRILYDFSGSQCEGYALQFRQVSEIDAGEGVRMMTDMRATTWEDAAAKSFRFNSQNFVDRKLKSAVDGRAEREGSQVDVNLSKPSAKAFAIGTRIFFPTDHMRRIIIAARAGETLLEAPVFDGSDTGEKVYDTLTVIGQAIEPQTSAPDDAAAGDAQLLQMRRWPVTISYFDKSKAGGDQTPVYGIRFELYENGISRALALDYNDFVVAGTMTSLEMRPAKPCE
ncbi:cell envelope integrity EipB family protein [Pseudorhodoplanes sp.]|uniref:cell envelope integrity EipB family protein n=1 Tax=Pseudorhodoplanes sp. TaxID=1934341 RepID=UPI003D0A9825